MHRFLVDVTDGTAGTVEAVLRNSKGELTHIVVGDARPWGREEIPVPIEQIESVEADHIHLRLDKRGLSLLPASLARMAGRS